MQVIFEIPGTFRITHIPSWQAGPWEGAKVHQMPEPFLVEYRAENTEKCESQQFPEDLFRSLVLLGDQAKGMIPYLSERYKMSDGMFQNILKFPKENLPNKSV